MIFKRTELAPFYADKDELRNNWDWLYPLVDGETVVEGQPVMADQTPGWSNIPADIIPADNSIWRKVEDFRATFRIIPELDGNKITLQNIEDNSIRYMSMTDFLKTLEETNTENGTISGIFGYKKTGKVFTIAFARH